MTYDHTFEFDTLPKTQSDQMHWRTRARYRRLWHERVWVECRARRAIPKQPLTRARVVCTRFSAANRAPDPDNAAYAFKCVLDGFTASKVWVDDHSDALDIEYRWEKAPRGEGRITVRIVGLDPPAQSPAPGAASPPSPAGS